MNPQIVEDTFAEAFRSYFCRMIITAATPELAVAAASSSTGFATSALGGGAEAGIEADVLEKDTPDGRPGVVVQYHVWKKDPKKLYEVLLNRVGHCVLTAPTAAAFDATPKPLAKIDLGAKLRFFGDGYERQGKIKDRDVVIIPIMGGEFVVEKEVGMSKGISGGNLWLMGSSPAAAINAAKAAVKAVHGAGKVITPFPAGICSSGSKIGARKYKFLANSTNDPYCPTLKGQLPGSKVPDGVNSIMEIVINGTSLASVRKAMGAGIRAAETVEGIVRISAGNFGGKLGKFQIRLRDV